MLFEVLLTIFVVWTLSLFTSIQNLSRSLLSKLHHDGIIECVLWIYRCNVIYIHQKYLPRRMNDFNRNDSSLNFCGVIPTPGDTNMETSKLITDTCDEDSISVWGGDKTGRFVVAKISHSNEHEAVVELFVGDETGRLFGLPDTISIVGDPSRTTWRAGGLLLECVEPMRSWRLKFNGQLKVNCSEQNIINCRIDFLWKAFKKPIDIWKEASPGLLADSIPNADLGNFFNRIYVDGYDQWGALHGTIAFEESEPQNWYLRGQRQHRFTKNVSVPKNKCVSVRNYFSDGNMFYLENSMDDSRVNMYTLGYLLTPSGMNHPITKASLRFQDGSEEVLLVKWSANGENKEDTFTLKGKITSTAGNNQKQIFVNASERSWALITITESSDIVQRTFEKSWPRIEMPAESLSSSHFVISLEDEACKLSSISGGKGASLSCLMTIAPDSHRQNLEFDVPNGFVVTTKSWRKQLECNYKIGAVLKLLQDVMTTEDRDIKFIKNICQQLVSAIENIAVCEEVSKQICMAMESTFPTPDQNRRYAVRSSACGEDGSESSSAGQNRTILGCRIDNGLISILKAIAECWASQFTYQSIEYRRQRGQPLESDMAVVVQEMVVASVAGVVFTNDPTNGSTNTIVITANYGLGESVVAASSEPDTIYLKRDINDSIQIERAVIGDKREKIVMKGCQGTENIPIDKEESHQICLKDSDAVYLARVAILIENLYRSPKDIEFAFSQGKLYILQARPITTLEGWSDYELTHEGDTAVLTDQEYFTRANTGEVFPSYVDSLTLSLVPKLLDLSVQRDFCMREWPSFEYDPTSTRTVSVFSHYCMITMGDMIYRGLDEKISSVNNAVDLAVFGRVVLTPQLHSLFKKRYGVMGNFAKFIRLGYAFYDFMINSIRIRRQRGIYDVYKVEKENLTAQRYYDIICEKLPAVIKMIETHCHTSTASSMSQCLALIVLSEGSDEITPDMVQNIAALFGCISDTESGRVPTALEELSEAICESGKSEEFLNVSPDHGYQWLMEQDPSISGIYKQFIDNHGHRCLEELYISSSSWAMKPETLMPSLKQMVKNKGTSSTKRQKKTLEETFETLSGSLKHSTKRTLRFFLRLCATAVNQREVTKSMTVRSLDAFKRAYRHLADLMVKEFRLPDRGLIYFLTHFEIGLLLKTRSPSLVTKAIRRRKLMKTLELLEFLEISVGVPIPIQPNEETYLDNGTDAHYGTPVCFGSVKGRARVVCRLDEADLIQGGEILITKSTDIGWSPYFPLLSGVVTEIGGLISHGAVVAREYGLPCVVGLNNATNIFSSGDMVFLDGKEGCIRKIEDQCQT